MVQTTKPRSGEGSVRVIRAIATSVLMATGHVARGQRGFIPDPVGPHVVAAGERIVSVRSRPGDVRELQILIDQTREANPDAILAIGIADRLDVTTAPLRLGSHESRESLTVA